jgi:hypothetical protein
VSWQFFDLCPGLQPGASHPPGAWDTLQAVPQGRTKEQKGDAWLLFARIVLGVAGIMRVFDAICAFRYHGVLPQNVEDALFGHSLKTRP